MTPKFKDGSQDTVEHKLDYVGPGPPCNSGLHRYAFLLFEHCTGDVDAAIQKLVTELQDRGGKKSCVAATDSGLGAVVGMEWLQVSNGQCDV